MRKLSAKKATIKAPKQRGFILYDGPSVLDGQPIVVIATMETSNRKTGQMVQTWIIRSDISPTDAAKIGLDSSVCGHCPPHAEQCALQPIANHQQHHADKQRPRPRQNLKHCTSSK